MTESHPIFDTFIFDLDGTILDTMPDLIHVTNETLAHFGYPTHTDAAIRSFVGDGAQRLIYRALPEGTSETVCAEALEYWKALYPQTGHARTRHYAHMPETLAELKARGCKLAVLSNKYEGGVKDVIPRFLPDLFEVLHGECEAIPRKPDPAGLLQTTQELGSAPERTAYVGDSASDMRVAHNAGTYAIGVDWGYNPVSTLQEAQAGAIISNPAQLLEFARA